MPWPSTQSPARQGQTRQQRRAARIEYETRAEYEAACRLLRERDDYHPVWEEPLELLKSPPHPQTLHERTGRPVVEHLCNQAPYELFHAAGLHPFRLGSGCFAASRLTDAALPALMCPPLRSALGMLEASAPPPAGITRIVPTACDWVVKFPELAADFPAQTCFLELPRLRHSEKSQDRWLEEMEDLVHFLETHTGRRLNHRRLQVSIHMFMRAWSLLGKLIQLRREGRIAAVWFMAAVSAFSLETVENWTGILCRVLEAFRTRPFRPAGKLVFLTGSPLLFPNLKLLTLIESAGLFVLADDLCSSERLWPGAVCYEDSSFRGLLRALAERYHRACQCPMFADNERRFHTIQAVARQYPLHGIIHHVLKGCHPFDIESGAVERWARVHGLPFIRIETDYTPEDSRTILTRLEAFAHIRRADAQENI